MRCLDRDVGARHLPLCHLGINESLGIGVLNGHAQHQRTAASVLRHLAGGIGITLHERHQSRRGQGRVLHGRTFRADVRQVMPHASAALHQLHLLLVHLEDGTVGIRLPVNAYHEAIGKGSHLIIVADASHRAALRHNVAEMIQQAEQFLGRQRIRILGLNARHLVGNAPVHILRGLLVDVPERVFDRIFVDPNPCGKLVALEVS